MLGGRAAALALAAGWGCAREGWTLREQEEWKLLLPAVAGTSRRHRAKQEVAAPSGPARGGWRRRPRRRRKQREEVQWKMRLSQSLHAFPNRCLREHQWGGMGGDPESDPLRRPSAVEAWIFSRQWRAV